jgi:DMSO/TMAO reductase YedYZ molybdopterin-dependent catalytic subunit
VNPPLAAPAATVTLEGTVTALSLLTRLTLTPPLGAAAFNVTVQLSEAAPASEALLQERALTTARPVPLRLIVEVLPAYALLERVTVPDSVAALVGSNPRDSVAVCPGFNVTGKVTPEILKPLPVSVAELMVSGAVPEEVSVTDCVEAVFTTTLPKLTLLALRVSAGIHAFS